MTHLQPGDRVSEDRRKPVADHRRRPLELLLPARVLCLDDQRPVYEFDARDGIDGGADGTPPCERHLLRRQRRLAEDLSEDAGHDVLDRNHVGRIAGRVMITG